VIHNERNMGNLFVQRPRIVPNRMFSNLAMFAKMESMIKYMCSSSAPTLLLFAKYSQPLGQQGLPRHTKGHDSASVPLQIRNYTRCNLDEGLFCRYIQDRTCLRSIEEDPKAREDQKGLSIEKTYLFCNYAPTI